MVTEEELGQRIGARLRAEVADLEVQHDAMVRAVQRRHARSAAAIRGGLAITAIAALAVTGIGLSAGQTAPSSSPHKGPVRIVLDGNIVTMPAGTIVQKAGPIYRIGNRADGFVMALLITSGPDIASQAAQAASPGHPAVRVHAGSMTGWWVGESYGGVLWLQPPGLPHGEYLMAKVFGPARIKALALASRLDFN